MNTWNLEGFKLSIYKPVSLMESSTRTTYSTYTHLLTRMLGWSFTVHVLNVPPNQRMKKLLIEYVDAQLSVCEGSAPALSASLHLFIVPRLW